MNKLISNTLIFALLLIIANTDRPKTQSNLSPASSNAPQVKPTGQHPQNDTANDDKAPANSKVKGPKSSNGSDAPNKKKPHKTNFLAIEDEHPKEQHHEN